jgi:hypothetical protein
MILIPELKIYTAEIKAAIPAIKTSHMLLNEAEVVKYLNGIKKTDNQIMLTIIPDAQSKAKDEDNIIMNNAMGFFFLEKTEYSSSQQNDWIAIFERTQATALEFVKKLIYDKTFGSCGFNKDLDVNNISIKPESGLASCNGWSVEVYFDTPF